MCSHVWDKPLYYLKGIDQMIFSASRIGTWIACNRKAAWQYIAGYDDPGTAASEKGTAVHAVLEDLKKTGALPDRTTEIGAIAAEALPYVNELPADVVPEGYFTFAGRHQWQGYKDLSWPGGTLDYKSTSDFKWAKTPEVLAYNEQAILYAESEFSRRPAATTDLMWLYLRTKRPYQARPVHLTMSREHAALGFRALESFADEMLAAADAAPVDVVERHKYVLTLAPNEDRCNDYGGCPHRSRCADLQFFRDPNLPGKDTHMNVLERMKQLQAAEDAARAAPAHLPAAPGLPASVGPGTFTVHAAGPAAGLQPGVHPLPSEAPTAPHGVVPSAEESAAINAAAINPPKRGPGRPRKVAADPAAPVPTTVAPNGAGGATSAKLAALLAAPPPDPAAVVASVPPPAAAPTPPPAAPTPITPHTIATLFVGCMPVVKGQAADSTDFDQIWSRAKEMIGAAAFFGGYGYKTNGLMLEAVQRIVAQDRPSAVVVTDPRTPEAVLCLSYLRANATVAVESLR
jgi:hypothetical protein